MASSKEKIMKMWRSLPDNMAIRPAVCTFEQIGSSGCPSDGDSIRITGSDEFIRQVLSNLKSLMDIDLRKDAKLKTTLFEARDKKGVKTGGHQLYMCAADRYDNPLELDSSGNPRPEPYDGSRIPPEEYYRKRRERLGRAEKEVAKFTRRKW